MSRLRDLVRRASPPGIRSAVRRFKKTMLGPPIFEVELGDYRFAPDPNPRPRFTLVLPSILRRSAFGGVTTGLEIFFCLAKALQEGEALDLRVLVTNPEDPGQDNVLAAIALEEGFDPNAITIRSRCYKGSEVATRARELFMPFNWFSAGKLRSLLEGQLAEFGGTPRPLVYPIQEYEPCFHPFSADHLLCREVYDSDWPVHAIINSSQLATWLSMLGHDFTTAHVFEPQLNKTLRPYLGRVATATRSKRILVYGRPLEDRNCFPLLCSALQIWAQRYPEQADWEVVSAGTAHKPISLAGGRAITSVGKLSLEDYAQMLCETAVGVSLMASPHPSYPPLEMAHFGVRTITNRFGGVKDLAPLHDNILSLPSVRPEILADTLGEACRAFEADPKMGARGVSHMSGYLDGYRFPFMPALARDLRPILFDPKP